MQILGLVGRCEEVFIGGGMIVASQPDVTLGLEFGLSYIGGWTVRLQVTCGRM